MQAINITSLIQFDAAIAEEEQHIAESHDQFMALGLNRDFTHPDWDTAAARQLFAAALEARGEYRAYLLDRVNEALYCNANDAHTSGLLVNIG